ncbi:MAG: pirin family protein [Deltaproteobacteria bacterium]|nr:pirin family protein [Deltaproteobacteria bacterium]
MYDVRRSDARGHADHGWLDSRHTFSFADYHDPAHMGFRALRVINEDRVAPGRGFGRHPHRDMEILTYVVSGAVQHADSMGNRAVVRPGEIQRMTAGTGVTHSEVNPSPAEDLHLLQIWIEPDRRGYDPGYEQVRYADRDRNGRLVQLAAREPQSGAVRIHQDVSLWTAALERGARVVHDLAPGRHGWLQVVEGTVEVAGHRLSAGDGLAVSDETNVAIAGIEPAEILLFDLA